MKLFTKIMILFVLLGLILSAFAGCGGDKAGDDKDQPIIDDASEEITDPPPTEPTTEKPPTEPPTREERPVFDAITVIDCSTLDYNKLSYVTLSEENPAPGKTASWLSPSGGDSNRPEIFKAVFPAVDVTVNDIMTGAVKIVIWCSDVSEIGGGDNQLELSTRTNDALENSWQWTGEVFDDGWNTIYLLWEDANLTDPEPDNTSLTWLRIYSVGREADFMLAELSFIPYEQIPDEFVRWR